jgi:trigger factor
MKADLVDVNETRKALKIEIPSDVVDAEIDRVARDYSRKARIPGFRPGKAPARVIKQRFKDQILHDVAHDLVPRAVDEARERGGAGRYARYSRCAGRRRPGDDVHRVVRHGACLRRRCV